MCIVNIGDQFQEHVGGARVLVMVHDASTCARLTEYLSLGGKAVMERRFIQFLWSLQKRDDKTAGKKGAAHAANNGNGVAAVASKDDAGNDEGNTANKSTTTNASDDASESGSAPEATTTNTNGSKNSNGKGKGQAGRGSGGWRGGWRGRQRWQGKGRGSGGGDRSSYLQSARNVLPDFERELLLAECERREQAILGRTKKNKDGDGEAKGRGKERAKRVRKEKEKPGGEVMEGMSEVEKLLEVRALCLWLLLMSSLIFTTTLLAS